MIYSVLLFVLVLAVDLITDVWLYREGAQPDKFRGTILRCIGLAPCVYWLGWRSVPLIFFLYLILFNGFYNLLIGQRWEFLGTTSIIDRYLAKLPRILKYILLTLSIIFYLL